MEARALLHELLKGQSVPHRKVEDLAAVGTGRSDRNHEKPEGAYPFYVRSKDVLFTDTFEFDEQAIVIPGEGGVGEIFHFADGKYALHQRAYRIAFHSPDVLPKFAYYFFQAKFKKYIDQKSVSATVTSIRKPMITEFLVPIPALDVQHEIVRILDTFTALEAELEAELEARKKQFNHALEVKFAKYLETASLISTLGEISVRVSSGSTPLAGKAEYYENGTIPWLRTQEVRFTDIKDTAMRITETALAKTAVKWIPANCVIVAISGATAGRSAVNAIPMTTNQHCCNLEVDPEKASFRFVFYWLLRQFEELKAMGQGVRSDINSSMVKGYKIPLPPLAEQELLVSELDAFYRLINDADGLLPLELAARRKQYEFYRDQLLTFNEA